MNAGTAKAFALGAAGLLVGCTAMPRVEPVHGEAERALVVGEAFEYHARGEALDLSPTVGDLSLDEAVRLALKHSPQIQAALARVRQAEADARQTRVLPNPVLDIAFRLPVSGGSSVVEADLSAQLLSLVTRPGRIATADHRLRAAAAEALKFVLDVAVDVQRQYADVQAMDAQVGVAQQRVTILREVLDLTNARLRAGEATRLDVLTAQTEQSAVEVDLESQRSEQRLARIALARLIGQPSSAANWNLPEWSLPAEPALSEAQWTGLALRNRPELRAMKWELAALGQQVRIARADTFTAGGAGVSAEDDEGWSIGPAVSLPIPIFDTGAIETQRRRDQVSEQEHALTLTGRAMIEEVRKALETLRAAKASLDRVHSELIPLNEQRLQQARGAYRAGFADILSLRLAEQELQQARARLIDLQRLVARARFELDHAVGGRGTYLNNVAPDTAATGPTINFME